MQGQDSIAAIIVAAGRGERAGGGEPKQYRPLLGQPVVAHAVASLLRSGRFARVLVVIAAGEEARMRQALGAAAADVDLVTGGATRQQSVANALARLAEGPDAPAHVMIHDGARPFIPAEVIERLGDALAAGAAGAMPVLPVADTLVRGADDLSGDVVPRDGLWRVQTPQAFRFDLIRAAHAAWTEGSAATDDAQMVRALGHEIRLVPGDHRLEKITMAEDFARVAALNGAAVEMRTGMGYDVHRLAEGEELWLCGLLIPHSHGLAGHSDADVAIHALVDALLGALAEGDIGQHFPPSDPQWRGAPSSRFLEFARDRVVARGGRIAHVDLTIICEAPKIGPHRPAMRARLAALLDIDIGRVSVKATTTEGLDATGRREGIAVQAVASLLLPA